MREHSIVGRKSSTFSEILQWFVYLTNKKIKIWAGL